MPGVLNSAKTTFRMRHEYGEAAVRRSHTGNTQGRAAWVERINLRGTAAVIHKKQRDLWQDVFYPALIRKFCITFAMRNDDWQPASSHAFEEYRGTALDLYHNKTRLELR
jgi:hypothetical protein